ncbi:MAG: lantibiotic dehydratase, partial [Chthoniobacterales bacterium]
VAPLFLIRATGVPFDHLERLGTTRSSVLARQLLVRRSELFESRVRAEEFVGSRASGLSADDSRSYRALLRNPASANGATHKAPEPISQLKESATAVQALEAELEATLHEELERARAALMESARSILPGYLVFGAGEFRHRLPAESEALPPRNARARERERHFLLYLQRVCAKNDTYSEFGPSAWGTVGKELAFAPRKGIAAREAFLERWTAHTFAAALNADAEIRDELAPRVNPNGRIEGETFVLCDTGEVIALSAEEKTVVTRCDGKTPAHQIAAPRQLLENLAAKRVLNWRLEVPAMDPDAFGVIAREISRWRDTPAREPWLERADALLALAKKFPVAPDLRARAEMMEEARRRLDELGGKTASAQRFLYAAANPIAEECTRDVQFSLTNAMTDELTRDIAPWLDLWRDTYAFVGTRVANSLRGLLRSAPTRDGVVALPAFLQHCAEKKMPLTGPGIVALAHIAFQELKGAFRQLAAAHVDEAEWELTAEDCSFVRKNFEFTAFDEYTFPAADLQLSAASFEAIARGDYRWVVSELHPPVALLHHALYWSCPDKPRLSAALASTTRGKPNFHFGFFAADFTAHTTVRQMDALPELTNFVAAQRPNESWRAISPAEVEVFADETGDVGLRRRCSGEYLGSFARAWLIPLGFHPFHFGGLPHMPRLRCGKAIVQRRAWIVTLEEMNCGNANGRELVLALEQLRAARDLPRYVYIRPTETALRRSGAEGRDKDTKPVFVDLESYLCLEVFHRWLNKAGELEVTEMLPDPGHLCWQEEDGRRTFELRSLIVPRE